MVLQSQGGFHEVLHREGRLHPEVQSLNLLYTIFD